jgi:uncharacterized protein
MNTKINIDNDIFKKHKVKFAYLFGSRVKGTAAEESDYDVAALFKELKDPLALVETMDLSADLRAFFPAKLDLVGLNFAPLLLKYEVVAHNQLLYCEDEKERIDFEVRTTKMYLDERYTLEIYYRAMEERIKQEVFS